jgi:hypothetical protein
MLVRANLLYTTTKNNAQALLVLAATFKNAEIVKQKTNVLIFFLKEISLSN